VITRVLPAMRPTRRGILAGLGAAAVGISFAGLQP